MRYADGKGSMKVEHYPWQGNDLHHENKAEKRAAIRQAILDSIESHPGSSTREIADRMGPVDVMYHLKQLEKEGLVVYEWDDAGKTKLWSLVEK